ncbi:MAG: hypothetical protein VYA84_00050 [Planctomycetota bacterium]|nr:hypothetical protein [Planctomycetota bacterium]
MLERDRDPSDPPPADAADPFSPFVPAAAHDSDSRRDVKFDQFVRGDTVGLFESSDDWVAAALGLSILLANLRWIDWSPLKSCYPPASRSPAVKVDS